MLDLNQIRRYQTGDIHAFEEIIRIECSRLMSFIERYVGQTDLAEDIYQETWIKIWRNRKQLRNPQHFRAWIYQIARSSIREQLKQKNWSLNIIFLGDWEQDSSLVDLALNAREKIDLEEWHQILNQEVAKFDEDTQEILALRFEAQLNLGEIARVLNLQIGTVGSKIHRALNALRKSLERQGIKEFPLAEWMK